MHRKQTTTNQTLCFSSNCELPKQKMQWKFKTICTPVDYERMVAQRKMKAHSKLTQRTLGTTGFASHWTINSRKTQLEKKLEQKTKLISKTNSKSTNTKKREIPQVYTLMYDQIFGEQERRRLDALYQQEYERRHFV